MKNFKYVIWFGGLLISIGIGSLIGSTGATLICLGSFFIISPIVQVYFKKRKIKK